MPGQGSEQDLGSAEASAPAQAGSGLSQHRRAGCAADTVPLQNHHQQHLLMLMGQGSAQRAGAEADSLIPAGEWRGRKALSSENRFPLN